MKIASSSTCPSSPSSQLLRLRLDSEIWNRHSFFHPLLSFTFFMILPILGATLSRNVQLFQKDEANSYIPQLKLQLKTDYEDPLLRPPPFQRFVSSDVVSLEYLQRRSSENEDSTDGGSLIITLDIALLSLIAVVIIAFVLFEFYQKVKRKSRASLPMQIGSLPMQDLGTQSGTENSSSTTLEETVETFNGSNRIPYSNTQNTPHSLSNTDVLEGMRETDNNSGRESLDSIDHYSSHIDEDDDHMSLARPPPSALTSTRSWQSSPNTIAPSRPGTSYAIPDMYGDPYPTRNHERDSFPPGKGPSSNSTHSRNSFMSFMTLSRFPSNHTFPDEPALADTRSQVLARDLSQSSSGTLRSSKRSKIWR